MIPFGRRCRIIDLPEAGKPEGLCPECGPHGNRGAVTLLWSIVPCLECNWRAGTVSGLAATDFVATLLDEIRAEGCDPVLAETSTEVEPLGEHPWARRVVVTVPYRHAAKAVAALGQPPPDCQWYGPIWPDAWEKRWACLETKDSSLQWEHPLTRDEALAAAWARYVPPGVP
jgi:hypothetical protein